MSPFRITDAIATAVAVLLIVWMLGYYGPSLDEAPDSPVVTDAQAAAMHVYMEELAGCKGMPCGAWGNPAFAHCQWRICMCAAQQQ